MRDENSFVLMIAKKDLERKLRKANKKKGEKGGESIKTKQEKR